jgi:hypothetical protein
VLLLLGWLLLPAVMAAACRPLQLLRVMHMQLAGSHVQLQCIHQ